MNGRFVAAMDFNSGSDSLWGVKDVLYGEFVGDRYTSEKEAWYNAGKLIERHKDGSSPDVSTDYDWTTRLG